MKPKVTLIISAFLTAAILTVAGGIITQTGNAKMAIAAAATQTNLSQATQDAEYQALINQANQTINQANAEITGLQNQLQQQTSTPMAANYAILPDQAATIASNATGQVAQNTPGLVNYNGTTAYEVQFQNGNVYVDANSGTVLYNGVSVAQVITAQQAAQIAINYSGNTSVMGVATGLYNNQSAFQITFQNGEVIYVDGTGNVLAVQLPPSQQNAPSSGQDD
jgi:uncharacterized membrane protein YkoI